jgi:alpha-galactosidase
MILDNGRLRLHLQVSDEQVPYIAKCEWQSGDRQVFTHAGTTLRLIDWLPRAVCPGEARPVGQGQGWKRQQDDIFLRALFASRLNNLHVTWVVELARRAPLVQLQVRLQNNSRKDIRIDWYPGWMVRWDLAGQEPAVKYWEALTYQPYVEKLSATPIVNLHSRVYSSDRKGTPPGKVPYWQIRTSQQVMYFGIAWCGGWEADIQQTLQGTSLRVYLPAAETQLVLRPTEKITGPMIQFMPFPEIDEIKARAAWLRSQKQLARQVYGGPHAEYPFVYNHWYSARRNLTRQFLTHQVEALQPYGFDVFVLDDGWFEEVGDWTPDKGKFKPGELESVFTLMHDKRLKTGIWSCPWLVHVEGKDLPPEVDEPPFLRQYMKAYALDLAGYDFESILLNHIQSLKDQFDIDWWKYDQELFGETSRHGKMKNIIALQQALVAVRRRFPDLTIESCMSGGRMINVFTDSVAQIHWIRDGGQTGYRHARSNVQEALGAIDFLSPTKVQRWTNRPNEVTGSPELLRCYCHSAMVGVWGVSADLYKITSEQQEIIRQEVKHYRRLNQYKSSLLYEILYPGQDRDLAGVVYYGQKGEKAVLLLFRWQGQSAFTHSIKLKYLKPNLRYKVTSADTQDKKPVYSAAILIEQGLPIHFSPKQLSALYFIQAE